MLGGWDGDALGHVLAAAAHFQVLERAAVAEPVEEESAPDAAARGLLNGEVGGVGVRELGVAVAADVVLLLLLLVVMMVVALVVAALDAVRVALEQRELQRQGHSPVAEEILDEEMQKSL